MIVCYACNLEAQNLGLKTDEVRKPSIAEDRINTIEFILDDAFYPVEFLESDFIWEPGFVHKESLQDWTK